MAFMDKLKGAGESLKAKAAEEASKRAAERKAQQEAAAAAALRLAGERQAAYARAAQDCPLPITAERRSLPGGLQLFNDEFLVTTAKDWGWSSQKLSLTTQRVIYSRGRMGKDQESCYLADVRDVKFHKPLLGYGTLTIETAGGHSLEGLPAASNGAQVRDRLLQLIHYARKRAAESTALPTAAVAAAPDKFEQLKRLGELRSQGILNAQEFEAEKAKLLSS